jgi:hypothetical protein
LLKQGAAAEKIEKLVRYVVAAQGPESCAGAACEDQGVSVFRSEHVRGRLAKVACRESANIVIRREKISEVVLRPIAWVDWDMSDEHVDTTPLWVESSALAAPVILGTAAGLLLGDLLHNNARRGLGLGLGVLGIVALLPFAVDGVAALITGPRSKFGVRRKIQKIRDVGIGTFSHDEVDYQLREQGVI